MCNLSPAALPTMIAQLDAHFIRIAPGRAMSRMVGYSLFEGRPLTTRGRWWNPLVFWNLRLATARGGGRVDRPVFIVGMGRSGTTLLGRILACHPSLAFSTSQRPCGVIRPDEDIIGSYWLRTARAGYTWMIVTRSGRDVIARDRFCFRGTLLASRFATHRRQVSRARISSSFVRQIFPRCSFPDCSTLALVHTQVSCRLVGVQPSRRRRLVGGPGSEVGHPLEPGRRRKGE